MKDDRNGLTFSNVLMKVSSFSFPMRQKNTGKDTQSTTVCIVYNVANPEVTTRYVPSANSTVARAAFSRMSADAKMRIRQPAEDSAFLSKMRNVSSGCSTERCLMVLLKTSGISTSSIGASSIPNSHLCLWDTNCGVISSLSGRVSSSRQLSGQSSMAGQNSSLQGQEAPV